MTDWVDRLVTKLGKEQDQTNTLHRIRIRNAEIIDAVAPEYVVRLCASVESLGKEINEKLGGSLGGVTTRSADDGCALATHGPRRVTVTLRYTTRPGQLKVSYKWEGVTSITGGPTTDEDIYRFAV